MSNLYQPEFNLFPILETEIDGIQMGVLNDGTPYLTARGLARMCGIDNAVIFRTAGDWENEKQRPRGKKILDILSKTGYKSENICTRTRGASGETHAYVDSVCMAFLEYYAFESEQGQNETALKNYRLLARMSFRAFIYQQVGYNPSQQLAESWKTFVARIQLNDSMPIGYFSILREMADLIVHMINAGANIDSHSVPDISVGQRWATHWGDIQGDNVYGQRIRHEHRYPDWFPQAKATIEAWIYPNGALGIFRDWLYSSYIPDAFPKYLESKSSKGVLEPAQVTSLLNAVNSRPRLEDKNMQGKRLNQ